MQDEDITINSRTEYAFCMLLGDFQGNLEGLVDAKIFEAGNPKQVGKLLEKSADHLDERFRNLPLAEWAIREGKIQPRMHMANQQLRDSARAMQILAECKPLGYHMPIVGSLVQMLACMLDQFPGGRSRPKAADT